jgi:hypothetical protein
VTLPAYCQDMGKGSEAAGSDKLFGKKGSDKLHDVGILRLFSIYTNILI